MTMTTWEFINALDPHTEAPTWDDHIDVAWSPRDPQIDVDWAYHTAHCCTD